MVGILSCVLILSFNKTGIPNNGPIGFPSCKILSKESAMFNTSGLIVIIELSVGPESSIVFMFSRYPDTISVMENSLFSYPERISLIVISSKIGTLL